MKRTGCAIHTLEISTFLNSTYHDRLENSLHVEATVTEEGTGELLITERRVLKSDFIKMNVFTLTIYLYFTEITMTKSETISLTYEIGKVTLSDLPKTYEHGSVIEGKVSLKSFYLISTILIYIHTFSKLLVLHRACSEHLGSYLGPWQLASPSQGLTLIIHSFYVSFFFSLGQTYKIQRSPSSKQSHIYFGREQLVLKTAPKSHYRQRWTGQLLS